MKFFLKVKPGSKREKVEQVSPNVLRVEVKEPPIEGRANEAVIRALAEKFGVAKSRIRLTHGAKGKEKIAEIE